MALNFRTPIAYQGSRLGRRLLIFVLLGSSFLAMIGTVVQLYVDYRRDLNELQGQLEQIRTSRLSSLSNSLWYLDEEQIVVQLDGMLELRDIHSVRVITPDGMEFLRGKDGENSHVLVREYELVYRGGTDRITRIGTLVVAADKSALYSRIVDRVLVILMTQGVKTFFVSIIILYLFNHLITRHLQRMAQYAAGLTVDQLQTPLSLDKFARPDARDEIDMVVDAFNAMRKNLLRDIQDRRDAEAKLKVAESSIRNILDSMPSVLIAVDLEGRVTQWNRQAVISTGIAQELAEGQYFEDLLHPSPVSVKQILDAVARDTSFKIAKVAEPRGEDVSYAEVTVYPLTTAEAKGAVIRIDDVTERVRLEEMMVQSEKMLSVGGLAAGMAHEINNPLAGILQNIQVLKNRVVEDLPVNRRVAEELGFTMAQLREYLERRGCGRMMDSIAESGKRAAKIVENMLSFSRKSTVHLASVDVCALLDQTVELASNDYDLKKQYDFRKISIEREYEPDVPLIACESSKIQQVFFNLIQNGAQAMARGSVPSPRFVLRVARQGEDVRIEIEDNGPGMPEEIRKRVFEPFFTTKPVGEGTGLGLSVSYFIVVENHGGRLEVESAPGQGAKFIVVLPVSRNVCVVEVDVCP